MNTPSVPDSLVAEVIRAMEPLIREAVERAYRDGYAFGVSSLTDRFMQALSVDHVVPANMAKATTQISFPPVRQRERPPQATEADAHPNSAAARRFPYGAVTKAFRYALKRAGPWGVTMSDLVGLVSERLGEDVSDMDHRDTIKRLKKSQELRSEGGRYFAGPKLQVRNENGASAALLLNAPEAGGAATPSDDSQSTARLIG